jgi:hypothetical protein
MGGRCLTREPVVKRFGIALVGATGLALLAAGCVASGDYHGSDYYSGNANYDSSCDYYTPPWGYPADYCRYRIWNQPVYYGGNWYSGPIYYRTDGGSNSFWLNGDWRRNEWRGSRPRIDWNRRGNQLWRGDVHRGRDRGAGRGDRRDSVAPNDGGRAARTDR